MIAQGSEDINGAQCDGGMRWFLWGKGESLVSVVVVDFFGVIVDVGVIAGCGGDGSSVDLAVG